MVNSVTYHMWLGMQVVIEDYVHDKMSEARRVADLNTFFSIVVGACLQLALLKLSSRPDPWPATAGSTGANACGQRQRLPIVDHTYDVVVVGAGGAGLRATVGMREAGPDDRLHHQGVPDPLAHGRRAGRHRAALGNMGEDDWRWHMYDTVKGSDWLGDQDAIEYLCREATAPSSSSSTRACRSRAPRTARSTSARSAA